MENIDLVYFINLERRKDRLMQIVAEIIKMEIPYEKVIHIKGIDHKFGTIGCSLSHINTLKHFINSGKNICLILEDDFKFTETKETVNEVLTNIFASKINFDCLMISGFIKCAIKTSNKYLDKVLFAKNCDGYIVTKEYAPLLLKVWMEAVDKQEKWTNAYGTIADVWNIDNYWIYEQTQRNFYMTFPTLGKQNNSDSDIIKDYVSL